MAITKSAKKAARQSLSKKAKNYADKERLKKVLHELRILLSQKKIDEAKKLLPQISKFLDKAAKTGLIKKNAAWRKKSRLAKSFGKA
jgi:small subunit ribosomal protein S20